MCRQGFEQTGDKLLFAPIPIGMMREQTKWLFHARRLLAPPAQFAQQESGENLLGFQDALMTPIDDVEMGIDLEQTGCGEFLQPRLPGRQALEAELRQMRHGTGGDA